MKTCTKCGETKPLELFSKDTKRPTGYRPHCKQCNAAQHAAWRGKNLSAERERNREYRRTNPDMCRSWRAANKEKEVARHKRNYTARKPYFAKAAAKRRAVARQAEPLWANAALIKLLYATRQYLTQETGEDWHVDHIVPLNGRHVCGLHVHNNLRVVPAKVNLAKGNKFSIT